MDERKKRGSKYFDLVIGDRLLGLEVEIVAKLLPRLQDARRHGTQRPARRRRQRTCGIHHLLLNLFFFNSLFLFEASRPKEISGDGRLILRDPFVWLFSQWCTINTTPLRSCSSHTVNCLRWLSTKRIHKTEKQTKKQKYSLIKKRSTRE